MLARLPAVPDRRVLRREAERVESERGEDGVTEHRLVADEDVAEGVVADVTLVRGTARIGVHAEHVVRRSGVVIVDLVGAPLGPLGLPAVLDLGEVVRPVVARDVVSETDSRRAHPLNLRRSAGTCSVDAESDPTVPFRALQRRDPPGAQTWRSADPGRVISDASDTPIRTVCSVSVPGRRQTSEDHDHGQNSRSGHREPGCSWPRGMILLSTLLFVGDVSASAPAGEVPARRSVTHWLREYQPNDGTKLPGTRSAPPDTADTGYPGSYPADIARWPGGVTLVDLGCPGETTTSITRVPAEKACATLFRSGVSAL